MTGDLPARVLRLQGGWYWRPDGAGLEIGSMLRRIRFRISGPSPDGLASLLAALRGGVIEEDAASRLARSTGIDPRAVRSIVARLDREGALLHGSHAAAEVDPTYHRQVRFFEAFEGPEASGHELNRRLQDTRLVIVGLGGYGSWLALMAARLGIREVVGFDGDHVEESNLNRQAYRRSDLGRPKAVALAELVAEVSARTRFEGHERFVESPADLVPAARGADLILCAVGYRVSDQPAPGPAHVVDHVVEAAFATGVPVLHAAGSWIGPLTIPGRTACVACAQMDPTALGMIAAVEPAPGQEMPAIAPRILMTATVAMWEAVRFLALGASPCTGGIARVDTFDYRSGSFTPIARSCARCRPWS